MRGASVGRGEKPEELAVQALAATGGKSTIKATEWILTHKSSATSISNRTQTQNSNSPPVQPKIDIFSPDFPNLITQNQDMAQNKEKEETEFKVPETITPCVNNSGTASTPLTTLPPSTANIPITTLCQSYLRRRSTPLPPVFPFDCCMNVPPRI